jgi:hypothetical protein
MRRRAYSLARGGTRRQWQAEIEVVLVRARVTLASTALREQEAAGTGGVFVQSGTQDANHLSLSVSLSAVLTDGRTIASGRPDLGLGGPRRGIWHRWHGPPLPDEYEEAARVMLFEHWADVHDIEDGINQVLGRDPTLHRPPRLSWGQLIVAVAAAGVHVLEQELIDRPLEVELTPDVEADLARD